MRTREERRAMLLAILDDPAASHGDRLRADAALAELELVDRAGSASDHRADLSPEEARAFIVEFREMLDAAEAVADGPDAVKPPRELDAEELLELAVEVNVLLERRVAALERALAWHLRHRLLLPAVTL